jgi:hypothetical protein
MSNPDHTRRLIDALYALERAIQGCPAGVRRKAAIELVVERVRRLLAPRRRAPAERADLDVSAQMDIYELLGKERAPERRRSQRRKT